MMSFVRVVRASVLGCAVLLPISCVGTLGGDDGPSGSEGEGEGVAEGEGEGADGEGEASEGEGESGEGEGEVSEGDEGLPGWRGQR